MASILIIDDDERLVAPLKLYFNRFNLNLESAIHPKLGLKCLTQKHYDLAILDVMLPDMDGFELCRLIRAQSTIPIVMLTARGDVSDRVIGLELADDYLAKPFEPRELVARIQNILKRTGADSKTRRIFEFDSLKIDQNHQIVSVNGKPVNLTSNEFQLLLMFVESPGETLSRDRILSNLKGMDIELFSRAVDIQISRLRKKLKPTAYIKTVWGTGYRFAAPLAKENV